MGVFLLPVCLSHVYTTSIENRYSCGWYVEEILLKVI